MLPGSRSQPGAPPPARAPPPPPPRAPPAPGGGRRWGGAAGGGACAREPQPGGGLGPMLCGQRAGDIVAVERAFLAGMAWRHPVAVAIKQHAGEEAGMARSSTASAPGRIAGELLLNGIPQRLIDDRRVFATIELAPVNDFAVIGVVLQHQVECAARERLAAHEPPGSARPRFTFDPARLELRL